MSTPRVPPAAVDRAVEVLAQARDVTPTSAQVYRTYSADGALVLVIWDDSLARAAYDAVRDAMRSMQRGQVTTGDA